MEFFMKEVISVLGIILAIVLIVVGFKQEIPKRNLGSFPSSIEEYVGGDAYNYLIEASIRGGEISGKTIAKAVYIVGGCIIGVISLLIAFTGKSVFKMKMTKNTKVSEELPDL